MAKNKYLRALSYVGLRAYTREIDKNNWFQLNPDVFLYNNPTKSVKSISSPINSTGIVLLIS